MIRCNPPRSLFKCIFVSITNSDIQMDGPAPQPDTNSCEIFGIAGVIIQLVLGFLSFSVLIFKRYREYPKRPWKIWALDISKQGVSQLIAHFINVGISILLSAHLASDACIWYFTTNVLDNTVGVFFCCGVLRLIETHAMAGKCDQFRSGNYYDMVEYDDERSNYYTHEYTRDTVNSATLSPQKEMQSLEISGRKRIILISYFAWFIQFLIWNLIVAVCKTILFFIELGLNKPLSAICGFLLGWLQPYPTFELIVVIIIVPTFMNGLAFWMQDNFLKKKVESAGEGMFKEPLM